MTTFSIKIISDTVCPFCYIAHKRLLRAISTHLTTFPLDTFITSFHAYFINPLPPSTPSSPERVVMSARFGSDRFAVMASHVHSLGLTESINFTFEGRVGSTRDSHRLIQLAKQKQREESVVSEIFKMYFEEGADITNWVDLVTAAKRGGLDGDEARRWLESGEGGDVVDREVSEAARMGVRGVPRFIINDQVEVAGADNIEAFLKQFQRVKDKEESSL